MKKVRTSLGPFIQKTALHFKNMRGNRMKKNTGHQNTDKGIFKME